MTILKRWSNDTMKYEPYEIPDHWAVTTWGPQDLKINCASCGRRLTVGESYGSQEIHTKHGVAYAVCEHCHAVEMRRRAEAGRL